ncbi:hypothetical protein H6CHR_01426 [Variovorax sp. PBL-H6]|nr:hypothetical protein H6CHR_01426 [Variovorax sp. PBL-H6]
MDPQASPGTPAPDAIVDDRQHMAAGFGEPGQALAGTHEELDAEFFLEFADLPAHAWLGGVERVGDLGEKKTGAHAAERGAAMSTI